MEIYVYLILILIILYGVICKQRLLVNQMDHIVYFYNQMEIYVLLKIIVKKIWCVLNVKVPGFGESKGQFTLILEDSRKLFIVNINNTTIWSTA